MLVSQSKVSNFVGRIARTRFIRCTAVVIDGVAWSVGLTVCLLVPFVSPAKTGEPIEMPIGW